MLFYRVGLCDLGITACRFVCRHLGRTAVGPGAPGPSGDGNVYSRAEFGQKAGEGHHFLTRVLSEPKIMLVGTSDDLEPLGGTAWAGSQTSQPRTSGSLIPLVISALANAHLRSESANSE